MKKADKKSYYAIIPADVRYDDKLPAGAKLLYGEITALCNEQGYCWASNKYFADLYNKENKTISRWIAHLIDGGYIQSKIDKSKGNQRHLYLSTKMSIPMDKNVHTLPPKKSRPMDKKRTHNSKDNNTENITDNKKEISQRDLSSGGTGKHAAVTLLRRYGIEIEVARAIVYDQHTPTDVIRQVIINGLAKEAESRRTDGKFVLEAGYIVAALNQARREGKIVGPTKASIELAARLTRGKRKYKPLSPQELENSKRRVRAQAAAMTK